jgi:GNAT superfamily N-acetyltransferase
MTIRAALEADLYRVFEMGVSFIVSEPRYAMIFQWQPEAFEAFVRELHASELAGILVVEDDAGALVGMLVLTIVPNPFGGPPWAEEFAYWLEPRARRGRLAHNLLGAAEDWARREGASVLKMVAPWGSQIGKLYERRGYEPLETIFILRL